MGARQSSEEAPEVSMALTGPSSARASRQSVPPFTEASVDRSSESYAFSTGESAEIVGASEVSL